MTSPRARGGKTGKGQGAREGPISLEFNLAGLPSSQHRAGLAGLVLMVQWLAKQPGKRKGQCEFVRLDDAGATLRVDHEGLRELLDLAYGATEEEEARPRPLKDKAKKEIPWIRLEERVVKDAKGKEKTKTDYFYPVIVPKGAFLPSWDRASTGDKGPWVKLWRDMVWSILRGVPATRKPFEARAKDQPAGDVDTIWSALGSGDKSIELPSTYFLGAQALTAENVGFRDRAHSQFLLHFWPFVAQVYVPSVIDPNKNQRNFVGYAIAVPDVAQLAAFCEELPEVLQHHRGSDMSGYRPRDCIIDVAAESALDLSRRLADRLRQLEGDRSTSDLVLGFDVFHMDKQGNNVRMLGRVRVEPNAAVIDEYRLIRESYWSPTFRKQRVLNLLSNKPWWQGFERLFETLPHKTMTVGSDFFRHDAREAFKREMDREGNMNKQENDNQRSIEKLVYEVVGQYTRKKTRLKSGIEWETAKGNPEKERAYNDAREKVGRDAFLAARSRTGADFADYFASSLCSVPQYLKDDDMVELSRALRERPEEIRTMTLLALSAWSWTPKKAGGESK